MTRHPLPLLPSLVLSLVLGSCADTPTPGQDLSRAQSAVLVGSGPDPRVVTGNRPAAVGAATTPIAAGRVPGGALAMSPAGERLAASVDGRELLSLLVACALPQDQTLVATLDGSPVEFFGGTGLAPEWLRAPLSESGREWVSACVLAELSGEGSPAPISLRGQRRELSAGCQEQPAFSKGESTKR